MNAHERTEIRKPVIQDREPAIRNLTAEDVEHVSGGQGVIAFGPARAVAALYPH